MHCRKSKRKIHVCSEVNVIWFCSVEDPPINLWHTSGQSSGFFVFVSFDDLHLQIIESISPKASVDNSSAQWATFICIIGTLICWGGGGGVRGAINKSFCQIK